MMLKIIFLLTFLNNAKMSEIYKSEDQLQSSAWTLAWNEYTALRRHIWHVPNGGSRNKIEAAKLKGMGQLAGVWDWHCFYAGRFYIIEFKVGNNQLTLDKVVNGKKHFGQSEWGAIMVGSGATAFICRNIDDVKKVLDYILNA